MRANSRPKIRINIDLSWRPGRVGEAKNGERRKGTGQILNRPKGSEEALIEKTPATVENHGASGTGRIYGRTKEG